MCVAYRRRGPLITNTPRLRKVFLSHSKTDQRLRFFEDACSSAGVALRKMELEEPEFPPWRSIFREIETSQILFVSLSEALLSADYRHTQNWIDYEVGIACAKAMPVWVFEPLETAIRFPVPYCTHAVRFNHDSVDDVRWLKGQLQYLADNGAGRYGPNIVPTVRFDGNPAVKCINKKCGLQFYQLNRQGDFECPSCREPMVWIPPD